MSTRPVLVQYIRASCTRHARTLIVTLGLNTPTGSANFLSVLSDLLLAAPLQLGPL